MRWGPEKAFQGERNIKFVYGAFKEESQVAIAMEIIQQGFGNEDAVARMPAFWLDAKTGDVKLNSRPVTATRHRTT